MKLEVPKGIDSRRALDGQKGRQKHRHGQIRFLNACVRFAPPPFGSFFEVVFQLHGTTKRDTHLFRRVVDFRTSI